MTPVSGGTATVTVTAEDTGGLRATQTFEATVANRAPAPVGRLPALTLRAGGVRSVNVASAFEDPDDDPLTFEATSSDALVATASATGLSVRVSAVWPGTVEVTVTAEDPGGLQAEQAFEVTVPNRAPVAVGTLAGLSLASGGSEASVDVSGAFADPEDDPLTFAASSSAPTVAAAVASNSTVMVTPLTTGTAIVTATATDVGGSNTSATQRFGVGVDVPSAGRRARRLAARDRLTTPGIIGRTGLGLQPPPRRRQVPRPTLDLVECLDPVAGVPAPSGVQPPGGRSASRSRGRRRGLPCRRRPAGALAGLAVGHARPRARRLDVRRAAAPSPGARPRTTRTRRNLRRGPDAAQTARRRRRDRARHRPEARSPKIGSVEDRSPGRRGIERRPRRQRCTSAVNRAHLARVGRVEPPIVQLDEPSGCQSFHLETPVGTGPCHRPASRSGGLGKQVQPVAVGVPAKRCGTDEGGQEGLVGMASSAPRSAGPGCPVRQG